MRERTVIVGDRAAVARREHRGIPGLWCGDERDACTGRVARDRGHPDGAK
jgi:hypothetical protein